MKTEEITAMKFAKHLSVIFLRWDNGNIMPFAQIFHAEHPSMNNGIE